MALYYRILWWVLEVVTHVMFIACMLGISVLVLWIAGHRPCLKCRRRERKELRSNEEARKTREFLDKYKKIINQERERNV